jgi:hypothetical protein
MKLKKEPHKGAPSLIMINLIRLALRVARKLAQNEIKNFRKYQRRSPIKELLL